MSGPGWLYLCCLSFSITYTVLWFPSETDRSIRRRFDGSSVTPSVTGEGCRDGLETVNLLWLQSWCQAPLETWNLALLLGPHTLPRGWRGVPLGREHDLGVKWVFSWGQFLKQLGGWMLSHEGTWAGSQRNDIGLETLLFHQIAFGRWVTEIIEEVGAGAVAELLLLLLLLLVLCLK